MNKIIKSPFVKICLQGIIGSFVGIVAGTMLGCLIYFLQFPLLWISNSTSEYTYIIWQNAAQPGMFGASIGAVLGGIFGAVVPRNNTKKTE